MPRISSARLRRANRKNARKSTGPRTPAGKAAVARNALKHGLQAKDLVLPAENKAEFDALLARLFSELRPRGEIQESLVERIAASCWKLRRVYRFEAAALTQPTPVHPDPHGTSAPTAGPLDSIPLLRIVRFENRLHGAFYSSARHAASHEGGVTS